MAAQNSWCRLFSPGATRPSLSALGRERVLQVGPFAVGRGDHAIWIAGEFLPAGAVIKQEQALAADHPHIGIARDRKATRDADRIVTAILRHIDVRRRGECGTIADIGETPD